MFRVLIPLAHGFEEIEAITTIDILRRAEVDVVVAGVEGEALTGSHQISVQADTTLETLLAAANSANLVSQFDALVLTGGPGTQTLQTDPRISSLVDLFAQQERWMAAICAAPMVLAKAGILAERSATSFYSPDAVHEAINGIEPINLEVGPIAEYKTDRVVVDGKVITSRGAGTAVDFALQLVAAFVDVPTARTVAAAIHSDWVPMQGDLA